ncbi:hypothetical protein [Desertivirga arenae]|uniref:hypothetical protein n=1 Tax=Desertivirga arenae TaxID=2810309 RepID=UPI001A95DD98|nr:hypothetical protein [Pedobacter sp. SYSU D00823]
MDKIQTRGTLKVKDTNILVVLIIPFCLFPIVFFGVSYVFSLDFILTFIIVFVGYSIFFIWFVKTLRKVEDDYAIEADQEGLYLEKFGKFKWDEISSIESFRKRLLHKRYEERCLRIMFYNRSSITINAHSFDMSVEEIAERLSIIGNVKLIRN